MQLLVGEAGGSPAHATWRLVALALVPLVILAALLALAPRALPPTAAVPAEELTITRVDVTRDGFVVHALSTGRDPTEVALVAVNDLLVGFDPSVEGPLGRMDGVAYTIPFRWVETEPYAITLVTSTGFKFDAAVAAAVETPAKDARTFGVLAVLGIYVGVVPVLAGLLWRPLLERAGEATTRFVLGLTLGLLVFLAVDTTFEAFEVADAAPAILAPEILLVAGALGAFALLLAVGERLRKGANGPLALAALVAVGIGLHNLAEGLAIGGAFALGEAALGLALVVGFALHNTTEGLAIVGPLAHRPVKIAALVGLGLVAGVPTILGAWIGGFAADPTLALVFLAVGVGAIAAVVVEIDRGWGGELRRGVALAGAAAGFAIMYVTGLFVVV